MSATCETCDQPMIGNACTETEYIIGEHTYQRWPYGPAPKPAGDGITDDAPRFSAARGSWNWEGWPEAWPQNCHDCGTPQGGLHHPGCAVERCPRCGGQSISCECPR